MSDKKAFVRVPASTSNLGSAFDSVGLALQLYLTLELGRLDAGESRLEYAGEDAHLIPTDSSNLIWQVMAEVAHDRGAELPAFAMRITNEIPITKGLGSSATACLAGAAASDILCNLGLTHQDLLDAASRREGHPDNVAPALYGGLVASISDGKILCSRSPFPESWSIVAVTPAFELETKRARGVLPEQVTFSDAVYNVQRAAFLMAQVVQGRREGVREAMADRLHQPYRSALLPGFEEILSISDRPGLIGVALSGAGSTVVAFADNNAAEIGEAIRAVFARHGLPSKVRLLKADNRGLTVSF